MNAYFRSGKTNPQSLWLVLILLCPLAAIADNTEHLQSLRNTSYELFESDSIGRSFHIYTMLPDSYRDDKEKVYPTIYILDGGRLFPLLTAYNRHIIFDGVVPESIIVGISYGTNDFEGGNFRSTDFTAPAEGADHWGGAEDFHTFLAEELIPHVESINRADPEQRILFGHSLAGQFVLFTAQTSPELFWGYIASNPALHRNLELFLQELPFEVTGSRLFVGSGTQDVERFRTPLLEWIQHWRSVADKPWELQVQHLQGHTHMSAPPAAFRQGLSWLYAVDSAN